MARRITERREDGHLVVTVENSVTTVDILPEYGARIWRLVDTRRGIDWIWRNPKVPLGPAAAGASYDDSWAGGWEQLFPNDAAGEFDGRDLPDHGEWWRRSWEWAVEDDPSGGSALHLWIESHVVPARCDKWISVPEDGAQVRSRCRIENLAADTFRFLFKEHLAVAIGSGYELHLPGGTVTPVDLAFSTRIGGNGPFTWPFVTGREGGRQDLRKLPAGDSGEREFIYVTDLPEGWCEVRDPERGAALRMTYSQETFPYAWFFMTFGGWRDLHTIVLEPCTNVPKSLADAAAAGRCASLEPHQVLDCTVTVAMS